MEDVFFLRFACYLFSRVSDFVPVVVIVVRNSSAEGKIEHREREEDKVT